MKGTATRSRSFDGDFLASLSLSTAKLYTYSGYHLTGIHPELSSAN